MDLSKAKRVVGVGRGLAAQDDLKMVHELAAVLHDLNQACRYASHLIALREGKIVAQGAPKEIVTAELIERIYGLRCMIIDDPVAGTPLVVPLGRTAPSTANS